MEATLCLRIPIIGYPINLYGTVLVGDELDHKRVYFFRRDRDNCQLMNSQDESLTLTSPSRGLLVFRNLYFEINLKISGDQQINDREFSEGFLIDSVVISVCAQNRQKEAY